MKLKLDDKGNAVLQDGKPVYVHEDGKEVAFDAAATVATISRLNAEAKSHRERAETAEGAFKPFKDAGITDPAAAAKALNTVKNLDDKKLVDAGEVEKVKAEAIKAVEEKYAPIVKKANDLEGALYAEKIGGSFARSKFIAERVAVPADMLQATFGAAFKIEDGKIVATDRTGNKVFSRARPGELADFDEALESLIDQYPHKAHILKGSGANGGGAAPASGGKPGRKTMTRAEFEGNSPADRLAFTKGGGVVTD